MATKRFVDDGKGNLKGLECIQVEWSKDTAGCWQMNEIAGSEFSLEADLVTLAMGFAHPIHAGMLQESRSVRFRATSSVPKAPMPTSH